MKVIFLKWSKSLISYDFIAAEEFELMTQYKSMLETETEKDIDSFEDVLLAYFSLFVLRKCT